MPHDKAKALSEKLTKVAQELDDLLAVAAGERIGFVLAMSFDGVAQYISNVQRSEGSMLLESLLERWKDQTFKATPAHTNPEL